MTSRYVSLMSVPPETRTNEVQTLLSRVLGIRIIKAVYIRGHKKFGEALNSRAM